MQRIRLNATCKIISCQAWQKGEICSLFNVLGKGHCFTPDPKAMITEEQHLNFTQLMLDEGHHILRGHYLLSLES